MATRRVSRVALVVALLIGLLGFAPVASADQFIWPASQPLVNPGTTPTDWNQTYCWGPGFTSAQLRTAATAAMSNLDGQSGPYADTYLASCASADVVYEQNTLTPGLYGQWSCASWNAQNQCLKGTAVFDTGDMVGWNAAQRQQALCHETGHSIGLSHHSADPSWGCMVTDFAVDGVTNYNAHSMGHAAQAHASPFGQLVIVANAPGVGVRVIGWAIEPDVQSSPRTAIQVQVDTYYWFNTGQTNVASDDYGLVNSYPYWGGAYRKFDKTVGVGPGWHNVCVWANNAAGAGSNTLLGCYGLTLS